MKRACQASCFSTWPWLHYQTPNPDNVVFCYVCVSALKSKRMDRSRDNLAITSNGFNNWKDATISFKNYEASASHKEALQVAMVLRKLASRASKKNFYGQTNPKMLPPSLYQCEACTPYSYTVETFHKARRR